MYVKESLYTCKRKPVYIYIYTYIHIHTYTCSYILEYKCVCVCSTWKHVCMCLCNCVGVYSYLYFYVFTKMCACVEGRGLCMQFFHVWTYVCTYTYIYVCMWMYACIYTYIYTHRCIHVYICIHIFTYMFRYIHIYKYGIFINTLYSSSEIDPGIPFLHTYIHMGWLRSVGSIKLYVSFAEYCLFCRALLQKRPIILSILLTKATPQQYHHVEFFVCESWIFSWFLCF